MTSISASAVSRTLRAAGCPMWSPAGLGIRVMGSSRYAVRVVWVGDVPRSSGAGSRLLVERILSRECYVYSEIDPEAGEAWALRVRRGTWVGGSLR